MTKPLSDAYAALGFDSEAANLARKAAKGEEADRRIGDCRYCEYSAFKAVSARRGRLICTNPDASQYAKAGLTRCSVWMRATGSDDDFEKLERVNYE